MIIVAPWARPLREDKSHPKNYPWWSDVLSRIDEPIVQVGLSGEQQLVETFYQDLDIDDLQDLIYKCKTWISVDSFFQHLCWDLKKPGVVIFGQSNPNIFGHPENVNLLKDHKYLRQKQFWLWEQCEYNEDAFVSPEVVIKSLADHFKVIVR
jgi:hypothetical protein